MGQIASAVDQKQPNILVVDDTPANLQLLTEMLKKSGYRVRPVPGGKLAIQAAQKEKPDLILLDINMPGMNGYEVCEHLKADASTRDIPVLFISALDETVDKTKAFSAGGVDYVTKPFQFEEVEARVQTHLRLRRLQIELERCNHEIQQNYDQLRKLEDLRDSLTHMIVHDMRSPLMAISGNLEYLMPHCASLPTEDVESLQDANSSVYRLMAIVNSMLDVSQLEAGQMPVKLALCDLETTAQQAARTLSQLSQEHVVTIATLPGPVQVMCDSSLIQRVLLNLLDNAAKFSPPGTPIAIQFESQPDCLKVLVCDRGPGVPAEYHAKIFDKFGQVEARSKKKIHSTGLGLAFCKLAVEAHGGQIGVESTPGEEQHLLVYASYNTSRTFRSNADITGGLPMKGNHRSSRRTH